MKQNEVKEVATEIIGLEGNKIFRTVIDLTLRPGTTIAEYCRGETQKYLAPVVYYFGVSTVVFYFQTITGLHEAVKSAEGWKTLFAKFGVTLVSEKVDSVVSLVFNPTVLNILMLPVMLLGTWVVFRKCNPSFKMNSWFTIFVAGHSAIFFLPPVLLYLLPNKNPFLVVTTMLSFGVIVYFIWAARQFYQLPWGKAILLSLLRVLILTPLTWIVQGLFVYLMYQIS